MSKGWICGVCQAITESSQCMNCLSWKTTPKSFGDKSRGGSKIKRADGTKYRELFEIGRQIKRESTNS